MTTGAPGRTHRGLLHAVSARVTGVDIDLTVPDAGEFTPRVTVTRIALDGPRGPGTSRRPWA